MKIKTRLILNVGLLFLLILLLGAVGVRYIYALKSDTEQILEDNYRTLEYARNMLSALDEAPPGLWVKFEENLIKQESNLTEILEKETTAELRAQFETLRTANPDSINLAHLRTHIFKIMAMNMQAIRIKSEKAQATALTATIWIAATAVLCFSIAFVLLIRLPSNIAHPIETLAQSISKIAQKNYSQRIQFEGRSEFSALAESFNAMAEKLEAYENSNLAKLMMEKKRIETLINNMHDPVIGLDEHLKVIFINEEAVKICGLDPNDIIGRDGADLSLHNDLIRKLLHDLAASRVSNGKAKPVNIYADGKESYFEQENLHIYITPTGETGKQLVGHVILLRNVTAYKELDRAKTNFLATVSHEFKTPIASIQMCVQLLENENVGTLNTEQKQLLSNIHDDTGRLLSITGELLNMTQIESGNIQLTLHPADPREIVAYAMEATRNQAEQKQVTLELDCPPNIPKIHADSEKTAWVLTNLISNAIRYSYDGATVWVRVRPAGQQLEFVVEDTGQGIAPQYQVKIFERYFRVPGVQKAGTGLGLAISKEFIEAQGGQIAVDSELGRGSTFTVRINQAV